MSEWNSALCGGVRIDAPEGSTVALGEGEQLHCWDGVSPLNKARHVYVGPIYEIADRCICYQFDDAPAPDNWAHEPIDYAVSRGLMNGTGSGRFSPDDFTSRAMIVTILYRVAGEPEVSGEMGFTDAAPGWYYDAVRWANANGIVNGYSDTRFGPDDPITREQFAAILSRFAALYEQYEGSTGDFAFRYPDSGELSQWAVAPMNWAVDHGIISGTSRDGIAYLTPKGEATRAQSAAMLMRFLINILGMS